MRIALVTDRYAPHIGGVETHVEQLACRMAAAGHDVEVLASDHGMRLPSVATQPRLTVRYLPLLFPSEHFAVSVAMWRELGKAKSKYDVVHVHNYSSLASSMAALRGCPGLVMTPHYHGSGHSRFATALHRPYRPLGRWALRRAERVVCVSEGEADLLRADFPFVAGKLRVISNGVEVARIRAAKGYGQPCPGRGVVLSVGRLEAGKNHQGVVQAMPHLRQDFCLRLVGDGAQRRALERDVVRLGLENDALILGAVSTTALHRWYRTASVFVTLSRQEAQSLVLLEALAAGCPVVASDIPAHRAVATQTKGSVTLIPPGASGEVVAAAVRDAVDRGSMPAAVPSWDDMAEETLQLYYEVAGARIAACR